jgi:antitoxin HigA-1
MAVRLAKAFGSSPETWLGVQLDYALAQVRRRKGESTIKRIKTRLRSARAFVRDEF